MAVKKKGLGSKGLGIEALLNTKMDDLKETTIQNSVGAPKELELEMIEPNRKQPRRYFDEKALEELANSLKMYGMIQPVVVQKNGDYYEIVAGERRWRAAKIAGLKTIPVVEKSWEDGESFEVALVENIQREDLNPLEEAESYRRLQDEFGLSQEKIGEKVGKSRSNIANTLRLLQLDPRVKNFLWENKITNGHARALLAITDGEAQFDMAEHVIEEECTVRETEILVKKLLEPPAPKLAKPVATLVNKSELEDSLKSIFATKVKISENKNRGKIEISYFSQDELDRILTMMKRMEG